jgi:CBS domain containing-hemolysin-like protein
MEIDDLNDRLNLELPKDDYETVAGFLLKSLERIPKIGEHFEFGSTTFIIKKADKRSIKEVAINIIDKTGQEGSRGRGPSEETVNNK